ncbi:MAG: cob(I)yrinic acid a,c-diamide adenosyltransferase [Flavobacteriales bacterium]
MKIYTKTGDKGETSLLGGARVPKFHLRIEAYGTVDELNSHLGLIRDQEIDSMTREFIIQIQNNLFVIGSHLAKEPGKDKVKIPSISEEMIIELENKMDEMNEVLPDMKFFVLPGGHQTVSHCHVARCVCRRAERICVHLSQNSEVDPIITKYLNRLSDYLFVLSRKFTQDLNAEEIPWKS